MTIKWRNIFLFALILLLLLAVFNHGDVFLDIIDRMRNAGSHRSADDRFFGLMVFGIIGIVIVAIVKILTQGHNRNP